MIDERSESPQYRAPASSGCPFFRERLHAYVEGELDSLASRFLGSHLALCTDCRREKERLEAERLETVGSLLTLPSLPARFPAKVIESIRRRRQSATASRLLLRRRFAAGLAVGLLIGAALVILALEFRLPGSMFTPSEPRLALKERSSPPQSASNAGGGEESAVPVVMEPDETAADPSLPPGASTPALDWMSDHLDRSIFTVWEKVSESLPCTGDINQDGRTNASDAFHLINHYIVVAPSPLPGSLGDSFGIPDCSELCELDIY